jgi:glycosyltransferase involved in cell wall biosynthesis/GT2 family glycosyltransferase
VTICTKIAVIICAYTEKRWSDLGRAVSSLEAQSRRPDEIILVIDHNAALLNRARVHFPQCRVVENTKAQGLSGARNSGIHATDAELIGFLDDDAEADVNWLHILESALDDPRVLGVGGLIVPRWSAGKPAWFPDEFLWVVGCSHRGLPTTRAEVRNLVGASMLIRRQVFATVGGFRSEIGRVGALPLGCEETEFCIRARQQLPGSVFLYEPQAIVYHHVPPQRGSWRYFQSRCYAEGVSKALVSRLVGSQAGLSAERAHAFKTLPLGAFRGLSDVVRRRDLSGLGRAAAIIAGLFITAFGYVRGVRAPRPFSADRPLKILMVSARYFPFAGGTETHTYEVSRRLAALGHAVTVLTTDPSGDLPQQEVHAGVHIRRVRAYPRQRDYYFAPGLFSVITSGDWDVVHLQGYHTLVAPLTMLAARIARIPYVVTFHSGGHSSALRNSIRSVQRLLLKPLLEGAAQLIGVSNFEAHLFADSLNLNRSRFVVIPNGASLPELTQPIERDPEPLIVSSGRLEHYKGHHKVIAALPKMLEQRSDVQLRIAGIGPYEGELHRLVNDLGVGDHVEIKGIPSDNRYGMAELIARASVVVLFSEYEAHPVAVMEALSVKRPVLVADTSGLSELAQRGLVRAIPLDSSATELASAIIQQIEQPLIPADVTLPNWDYCAAQLLATYQAVLR